MNTRNLSMDVSTYAQFINNKPNQPSSKNSRYSLFFKLKNKLNVNVDYAQAKGNKKTETNIFKNQKINLKN